MADFQPVLEHENRNGFNLVAIGPDDAILNQRSGLGTLSYSMVFERRGDSRLPVRPDKSMMKAARTADSDGVPCPVAGCDFVARRMTKSGSNLDARRDEFENQKELYMCPRHRIFISPTTFEYENPECSLLWGDDDELRLARFLADPANGKRTWTRLGRERDEDSVTWNVFRYLVRNNLMDEFLAHLVPDRLRVGMVHEKTVFWSVDLESQSVLAELKGARNAIGEKPGSDSEPDLIIVTNSKVIVLEVKVGSSAITKPGKGITSRYNAAFNEYGDAIFKCSSVEDSVDAIGYELFRFLLLTRALEQKFNRPAELVLLTRDEADPGLIPAIDRVLRDPGDIKIITWTQVAKALASLKVDDTYENKIVRRYLDSKTLGYDSRGKLVTLL